MSDAIAGDRLRDLALDVIDAVHFYRQGVARPLTFEFWAARFYRPAAIPEGIAEPCALGDTLQLTGAIPRPEVKRESARRAWERWKRDLQRCRVPFRSVGTASALDAPEAGQAHAIAWDERAAMARAERMIRAADNAERARAVGAARRRALIAVDRMRRDAIEQMELFGSTG